MTVERGTLVQYWPTVDVAKVDVRPGDVVILRPLVPMDDETRLQLGAAWAVFFPGATCVVAADVDFVVKRAMPEMRWEDLEQPTPTTTME